MGQYRCSQIPPVAVWSVVGISLLAFLCQSGLPPRVLDRFLFEFALVPSRVFGQLRLVASSPRRLVASSPRRTGPRS